MTAEETIIQTEDLDGTRQLGSMLAEKLPVPCVVALNGTLGAGKTTLVQAVAKHLGIAPEDVASPTFVLLREYSGTIPVYHFDAYRLTSSAEFLRLSPDDYFEGDGITFIEWADKFPDVLPPKHIEIQIDITSETGRQFRITGL
ncbi:MAG: tRNA (adenosine(37)-N6)-threonylcarbamoyltransferase complex ATPase subunit type 1 TsaE [Planctomycetaceae bacterium]|nr:tRNA (adenosine(37)-N6)-threonylcarbamoyltransferase complex ATPase subunit type 1 TsaE [Planctomycetaceae bacterium]